MTSSPLPVRARARVCVCVCVCVLRARVCACVRVYGFHIRFPHRPLPAPIHPTRCPADTSMLALGHRGTLRNSVGMYCVHNAEVNAVLIVREKEILVSQFTTHDAERVNEVRRLKLQEINRECTRRPVCVCVCVCVCV